MRDDNLVIRTDFSESNVRLKSVTYEIGPRGLTLGYQVFDRSEDWLYRAALGYSQLRGPTFGKILKENLYVTRKLRSFDSSGEAGQTQENPVYCFIFSYNDDGSANEPVGIKLNGAQGNESLFEPGGVLHMAVSHARIAPHIVSALNKLFPIEPLIQP